MREEIQLIPRFTNSFVFNGDLVLGFLHYAALDCVLKSISLSTLPDAGRACSIKRLGAGWTVRAFSSGGGEIFHTRPDRPQGPSSILLSECRVSLPEAKRPGLGVDHPPASSVEVKHW